MESALHRLRTALAAFRRQQGVDYLLALAGKPAVGPNRARAWLCSDECRHVLDEALDDGVSESSHGALAAHLARARVEERYAPTRELLRTWPAEQVALQGAVVPVQQVVRQWWGSRQYAARRERLNAFERSVEPLWPRVHESRAQALSEAAELLGELRAPRHADAGPEGGARQACEAFLKDSEGLTLEALAVVERVAGLSLDDGGDVLWGLRAAPLDGLFRPEGRLRRVAEHWSSLGLRQSLTRRARAERPHACLAPGAQLLPLAPPDDVRVCESGMATGLAAELAAAQAAGRALGLTLVSRGLPHELAYPTVGTVARALGGLSALMLADPRFAQRRLDLDRAHGADLARVVAAWWLIHTRLLCAQVLASGQPAGPAFGEPVGRALTRELAHNTAAWFALRLSPGGPARAAMHAAALLWALRERFDEDWYRNPRAAEPLRGAAARGGGLSVEDWCAELSVTPGDGLRRLAELF